MTSARPHTMPEGGKISLEWLPAGSLHVDQRYERDLSETKVAKIRAEFDPDAIGVLEVSRRDDETCWIIDGQHRWTSVLREWGDDEKLPCNVHHGLTIADEARIYTRLNRDRTKPNPINLHRSSILQGDRVAADVDRLVQRHGFRIAFGMQPKTIQAVGAVYKVYRSGSPDVLDQTLAYLAETGWDEPAQAETISGLGLLVARYGHRLDGRRMRVLLEGLVQRQVVAQARMLKSDSPATGGALTVTVAQLLLTRYNRGRRSGRIEWAGAGSRGGGSTWKPVPADGDVKPKRKRTPKPEADAA